MRWLFDLQQCGEAFAHFIEQFDWSHASYFNVSFLPRDTAHLIHQNDARNSVSGWNGNFKRVTSRPTRMDKRYKDQIAHCIATESARSLDDDRSVRGQAWD